MWIQLSFILSVDTPVFPGCPPVEVRAFSSLSRGDCSNTFSINFYNHSGTHMDAPRHFYNDGKAITDFRFSEFVYENPIVVNIPKQESELIMESDLLKYFDIIKEADLLLIRTGFTKFRSSEPLKYDMDLTRVTSSLRRVIIVPFLVQGMDSAPCTVFGEIT